MKKNINIIDLFAGVGGIRLGFERAAETLNRAVKCVYTSEIDKFACDVYRHNFDKDNHDPLNDITQVKESDITDFDVLLAGFPCQAFSIAGRRGGFEDTRGTLFFDVARIIKAKQPKAFLLENVKGLRNHRGGKTLATILNVLKNDLGYNSTQYKVINARYYGVPQNRERIYIVGFKDGGGGFEFPECQIQSKVVEDIIESQEVQSKYYLSSTALKGLKAHKERHKSKGNGFGYEVISKDGIANAIVVGGMGRERNLLYDDRLSSFKDDKNKRGGINREYLRKMTPLEWERLQGFPDYWTSICSDTQRYKQMGNSVAVPVIEAISRQIVSELINPQEFLEKVDPQLYLNFGQ